MKVQSTRWAILCLGFLMLGLAGCPLALAPAADFSADVTSGSEPLTVHFTDLSTPGTSPITEWAWSFGDHGTSTDRNPAHTYTTSGTFNVSLKVTNANGADTKQKAGFITVTVGGGEGEGEGEVLPTGFLAVPAGTFLMGRTDRGDDANVAAPDEDPQHSVQLTAYQIAEFDVTNGGYAAMLDFALALGLLQNSAGDAYDGSDVYSANQLIFGMASPEGQILYDDTARSFSVKSRDGFSMAQHPVTQVTWYGAALYCNWLSQTTKLTSCYDTTTWACNFGANGFHLPTEAQWERAAAWDAGNAKHWIYGFSSDAITDARANYNNSLSGYVNPLGLTGIPYTTPVGWFNGQNISLNGNIQTIDSASPVGCYDMSGDLWQYCNDWYSDSYYQTCFNQGTVTNPTGPATGVNDLKVVRGGSWADFETDNRTAARSTTSRDSGSGGFRLARF